MLRTDVIELVNGGGVWALVGSGPSIEAGGPSWHALVIDTATHLQTLGVATTGDARLRRAIERRDYLMAFSRLVAMSDRSTVEDFVRNKTAGIQPQRIARALADWPLAGIITTNYDSALETALQGVGAKGWVSVGNIRSELPKVTGAVERVVWHIHGAASLPERSRLILTQEDYDDLYLRPSEITDTLAGLLTHRRLVVVGFGFTDPEVNRLVRRVGALCSPERPVYAFLGGLYGRQGQADQEELRDFYNVDVIPYRLLDGDHQELRQLVEVYGALMVRRSLRLNQPQRIAPAWDAETTALLTYNELVLRHGAGVSSDVLLRILRSRIVARLMYEKKLTRADVLRELAERARLLADTDRGVLDSGAGQDAVDAAITGLVAEGLLSESGEGLLLTETGNRLVSTQHSKAELLREQFFACLRDRVLRLGSHPVTIDRVTRVLSEYFEDCMSRRGLGVALAWQGATLESRRFQATALLQHLPNYLGQLTTAAEVEVAVHVVQEVLAAPSQGEKVYLGVRTQAAFSVQLLAYAPELVATRSREIAETAFLLDSSVLIPLLAEGAPGYEAAHHLAANLLRLRALVATTVDFVQEVRDHARWAQQLLNTGGPHSTEVLAAATGRGGYRQNLFLAGFITQIADVGAALDFDRYLDRLCGSRAAHRGHLDAYIAAYGQGGVQVRSLGEWDGFEPSLWSQRDDAQDDIELARRERNTFRGELQVRAEAEARILVDTIRSGQLGLDGRHFRQAFFVSNSRVVDFVGGHGERVTMRAESVLQWLGTLGGASPEELSCLVDGLLWELADEGLAVVNRQRLIRVFAPTIDASISNLGEQISQYQVLTSEEYGEDARLAFHDPLDAPLIERALLVQRAATAEEERDRERVAKLAAERRARMTARDEAELTRLRGRAEERRRKAERRKRANKSRPRRKRRN